MIMMILSYVYLDNMKLFFYNNDDNDDDDNDTTTITG